MLNRKVKSERTIDLDEMRFVGFHEGREAEIAQCVSNVLKGAGTRFIEQCPLCRCSDKEFLFSRFQLDIVRCSNCGVGYTERFPIDVNDVYSNSEYLPIAKNDYLRNVAYRKKRFGVERLEIINDYTDHSPSETRLLDIGCGTGWFLECAKEAGFQVWGQEIGVELAEFTSKRLEACVFNCEVIQIEKKERFDVITMFDVLEHVANPRQTLNHLFHLLKPGGVLIIFVPNLESVAFDILKERSTQCMPVEHLFYFTEASLTNLLKSVGFKIKMFETKGMDIADLYSFYKDVQGKEEVASFFSAHFGVLQAAIDESGLANHMRFVVSR
jgi:SAM-dependent methyltransferase